MKKIFFLILGSLAFGPLFSEAGWAAADCRPKYIRRIGNVERVFMVQSKLYSLLLRNSPESNELSIVSVEAYSEEYVRFVLDVPEDKLMFVIQTTCHGSFLGDPYPILEIHLRQSASLEGGGWRYQSGKSTRRGFTQPID